MDKSRVGCRLGETTGEIRKYQPVSVPRILVDVRWIQHESMPSMASDSLLSLAEYSMMPIDVAQPAKTGLTPALKPQSLQNWKEIEALLPCCGHRVEYVLFLAFVPDRSWTEIHVSKLWDAYDAAQCDMPERLRRVKQSLSPLCRSAAAH